MKKQQGFTLVELLVVIAIIGLLSTLAVLSLSGIRERGRDTKRVNDMNNVQKAMELVRTEYGGYDDGGCASGNVSNCTGGNLETYLPTVGNVNDPQEDTTACNATCSTSPCNYSFNGAPAASSYEVKFYLETGVGDIAAGCHSLTQQGIN